MVSLGQLMDPRICLTHCRHSGLAVRDEDVDDLCHNRRPGHVVRVKELRRFHYRLQLIHGKRPPRAVRVKHPLGELCRKAQDIAHAEGPSTIAHFR